MSFILPLSIIRIIDFIGLSESNDILFDDIKNTDGSITEIDKKYLLCKDPSNDVFVVKLISNQKKFEINSTNIQHYLTQKSFDIMNTQVLKLKDNLSKNKVVKKELLNKIIKQGQIDNPDKDITDIMMDANETLNEEFEQKATDILIKNKLVRTNTVIKVPLSSTSLGMAKLKNREFPIYESLSVLVDKEFSAKSFGVVPIANNKHSIPIKFQNLKEEKFSVLFNPKFANKEILINLLNHSLRTSKEVDGFFLSFYTQEKTNPEMLTLFKQINACPNEKRKEYQDAILSLIEWINKNENEKILFFKKVKIYLPMKYKYNNIFNESLINTFLNGVINIYFSRKKDVNKIDLLEELTVLFKDFTKNKTFYGFYYILASIPTEESDTYGFLENNIHASKIMLNIEDTIEFCNIFRTNYADLFNTNEDSGTVENSNLLEY